MMVINATSTRVNTKCQVPSKLNVQPVIQGEAYKGLNNLKLQDIRYICAGSKVHLRDGADRKAPVDQAIVDEHVADAKQRDAQPGAKTQTCSNQEIAAQSVHEWLVHNLQPLPTLSCMQKTFQIIGRQVSTCRKSSTYLGFCGDPKYLQ